MIFWVFMVFAIGLCLADLIVSRKAEALKIRRATEAAIEKDRLREEAAEKRREAAAERRRKASEKKNEEVK